jgi:hypothetical protein
MSNNPSGKFEVTMDESERQYQERSASDGQTEPEREQFEGDQRAHSWSGQAGDPYVTQRSAQDRSYAQPPPYGSSYTAQRPAQDRSYAQPPPYGSSYTAQRSAQDRPYAQPPPYGSSYAAQRPAQGAPYNRPPYPNHYGPPPIPPEVKKWNWGAFTLNWLWGCGNGAFLALLCLIPVFNFVWAFVCGARGNVWAWKSGKFKDLDAFLATQRTWNIAGIILFCIFVFSVLVMIGTMVAGLSMIPWSDMIEDAGGSEYEWYEWY